jgi:hypothetical protein
MAISAISASNAYADYASARSLRAESAQAAAPQAGKQAADGRPAAAEQAVTPSGAPDPAKGSDEKKSLAKKTELTPEQRAQIARLQARDREVRQHEAAHLAASGGLATSGASFSYQKGADGVNYAIGGEVSINTSPGRTPQETIQRAQTIKAAALAPADPSGPDRAVAAAAAQMEASARLEQAKQGGQTGKSAEEKAAAPELGPDGKPIAKSEAKGETKDAAVGEKGSAQPTADGKPARPDPQEQKAARLAQAYGFPAGGKAAARVSVFA